MMNGINWPHGVCPECVKTLDGMCQYRKDIIDNQILIEQKFGTVVLQSELVSLNRNHDTEAVMVKQQGNRNNSKQTLIEKDCTTSAVISETISITESDDEVYQEPYEPMQSKTSRQSVRLSQRSTKNPIKAESKSRKGKYHEIDEQILKFMDLTCDLCSSKNFKTFPELRSHFTQKHKVKGYVMCCNVKHLRRSKLYEHIQYHNNPHSFKCDICQKIFNSSNNLYLHNKMTHLDEEDKQHDCGDCGRRFGTAFQLKQHKITHITEEEKQFRCDDCGKMFPAQQHLNTHVRRIHQKLKPYVCEVCARPFCSRVFLNNHITAKHNDNRIRIKCTHCERMFANELSLKKHMMRLNVLGEEFVCSVCGHESPNKFALKGHMDRQHTANRPVHTCSFCGKQFQTSKTLKVYFKTCLMFSIV